MYDGELPHLSLSRMFYLLRDKLIIFVEEELRKVHTAIRPVIPMTLLFTNAVKTRGAYIDHRANRIL